MSVAGSGLTIDVDGSASQPSSGLCRISGYNWDFGDSTSDVSYATGTVHTYSQPGTYIVTLTVTNQGGHATTSSTVDAPLSTTTCLAPHAAFSMTPSAGTGGPGGTIFGFDASASTNMGVPACNPHFTWEFSDGSVGPDAVSVTHQFASLPPGTVATIKLTVGNDAGSEQTTLTFTLQ
jgi:PKD repeat protein